MREDHNTALSRRTRGSGSGPDLLFDELLSNLDAKLRLTMRTEIRRLHDPFGGAHRRRGAHGPFDGSPRAGPFDRLGRGQNFRSAE
ncbi:hypothetical protein GCM10027416_28250 [Okibacterium endophyticum]